MPKRTNGVPPEPLPVVGATSPCTENDCRACCFDTRMPLLESDIARLETATGKTRQQFTVPGTPDEPPRLRNRDGHCVFLEAKGCSVYAHRPAGCRIYPLVMDPDTGQGVKDDECCPYTKRFRVRPRDRAALQSLVEELDLYEHS